MEPITTKAWSKPQGVKNGIQTSNKQVVNGKEITKKTFK